MVKYTIKSNPAGQYYFPKEIREALGKEVVVIPNAFAAAIFPKDAPLERVAKSLELILEDIKLRLEHQNDSEKGGS